MRSEGDAAAVHLALQPLDVGGDPDEVHHDPGCVETIGQGRERQRVAGGDGARRVVNHSACVPSGEVAHPWLVIA